MPPSAEGFASRLLLGPALRTQPDRRLVALVREGYETAFEEIVRRYGRPLARYAASIVGSRSDDVTQDAFSKALLAMRRDNAEIELRPWLFRIVRNTALNDLRDRPPSPEVLAESLVAGGGNPAEELERREELADLMRRLQELPDAQRAAIVMRELEGLSHDEIAAALGLTGGGARQAIYRARQALRDGAGMLVPLPLLQAMLGGGAGVAESAGIGAGIGGATGAGMALKATAATVLVAGAVGAGVALKDDPRGMEATAAPAGVSHGGARVAAVPDPAAHEGRRGGAGESGHGNPRGAAVTGDGRDRGSDRAGQPGGGSSGGGAESPGRSGPRPSHTASSHDDSGRSGRGSGDSSQPGHDGGDTSEGSHPGSSGGDFGSEQESGSGHDAPGAESGDGSHEILGTSGEGTSVEGGSGDPGVSGGSGGSVNSGGDGKSGSSGSSGDLYEGSGLTD